MRRSLATVLLLPGLVFAENWPEISEKTSIPRFQMVADGLYRGGQPDVKGFEFLKRNGVKTVINLRPENDEEAVVRRLGMNYVQIPVSVKPLFGSKIPEKAIARYFEIVNNPENYPIFFHCRRGADRTGAMAGFFRIANQGWDGKAAYTEARRFGMRWWYPGLKRQILNFKKESGTAPSEKPEAEEARSQNSLPILASGFFLQKARRN